MKFLVDAQLPRRISRWLQEPGHDARHKLDLPLGNRTPDAEVVRIADVEARIVVTKDANFAQSHLLQGVPSRLLLISTGNISNDELMRLFHLALSQLIDGFTAASYLELNLDTVMVH
jgi:predicted nuclease of predicted toxin-antitoxin system